MGTTPTYAFRYPELGDPADLRAIAKNLADDVETQIARLDAVSRRILLRQSAGQNIPNNAETQLTWNTIETNNGFDVTPGASGVPAPETGLYLVSCTVRWTGAATGYRRIALYLNSTLYSDQAASSIGTVAHPLSVSMLVPATAGQVIDVRATQTSGGSLSFAATSRTPNLIVARIG